MPGLFNYFEELANVNWSTVVIYTCKDSCFINNQYAREYAYIEFDDEISIETNIDSAYMDLKEKQEHKKEVIKQVPVEVSQSTQSTVEDLLGKLEL